MTTIYRLTPHFLPTMVFTNRFTKAFFTYFLLYVYQNVGFLCLIFSECCRKFAYLNENKFSKNWKSQIKY